MTNHETAVPARDRLFALIASIPGSGTVDWCSPARALLDEIAAVSVPPPAPRADDQAALRDRIRRAVCEAEGFMWNTELLEPDEYGDVADAVLAVLPAPADRAAVLREAAEALGRMDYDTDSHDYGYDTYRDAWNGGVMDGADLLRRLADEAAVSGPCVAGEQQNETPEAEARQGDNA